LLIKIALNGSNKRAPATAAAIAEDVAGLAAAGATTFHVHPQKSTGGESLLPLDADRAVRAIRKAAPGIKLGLTTGAWILPDVKERLAAIDGWTQLPDFASVNFDEDGSEDVARLLIRKGIGVEAGVLDRASTERFLASSIPVIRVLIELQEENFEDAVEMADVIVGALGDHAAPRLLHGHGAIAWDLFDEAIRRGYDSRAGLEDMLTPTSNFAIWNEAKLRLQRA
jgi:uncharacterized protein (DUF849 family)